MDCPKCSRKMRVQVNKGDLAKQRTMPGIAYCSCGRWFDVGHETIAREITKALAEGRANEERGKED